MRQIAVGKDRLVNLMIANQLFEFALRVDRDAVRIERPAQRGRVAPRFDPRNLRRSEGHDLKVWLVAKADIESMKVSSRRAENEDAFALRVCRAAML